MPVLAGCQGAAIPANSVPQTPSYNLNLIENSLSCEQQVTSARDVIYSRPSFHLTAPHGWLNDPCGLGYDPATGLYHLSFQWNPKGNDWGNISWGHSVSPDLISWKTSPEPCLTPLAEYDSCGIFTGCLRSSDINGAAGALTYIYTSVRRLPLHYTLPYEVGSESLSIAVSRDNGVTWQRLDSNPILPAPPMGLNVTAWRDPYIGVWAAKRGEHDNNILPSPSLSGFLSGGIAGRTPTVFVYSVNPDDLREWKYAGPLVNVGLNFRPSRWSGDLGVNWETTNWVVLTDHEGTTKNFIIMGVEGCLVSERKQKRVSRSQLWMAVDPRPEQPKCKPIEALADYAFSGIFDHGCAYAANSFWDPVTSQYVVYCWITEDDLPDTIRHQQGWSGVISLPRVLKLTTLRNVTKTRCSNFSDVTSIEKEANGEGSFTIRTLGIEPDQRLKKLRRGAQSIMNVPLCDRQHWDNCVSLTTSRWELKAEFAVGKLCKLVGIEFEHDLDPRNGTVLAWAPCSETFSIHRPPPYDPDINHNPEIAPHTLFTFADESGMEKEETLRIHAFLDRNVLEVFINERTVISTRIYTPCVESASRLRFFAELDSGAPNLKHAPAVLLQADLWDGLEVS
ncbi:glycosyl hydrolase family protein [Aspergillus nomiae NRRL 13137]|uniref:Glycosyl hydrolase family protein n=1 Tax=Aspergillus nomiae NRRL (strain ATCC 15546 / NRRL 13137 / CBS 260.88 / M93) TaxID=1509407 RepID=A0A0L1J2A8_ASPN3|nr:glycosyl hydrolase family protein [Aspergillus nomiae NRRL 13137]KNG85815.1 glycosyl hydrolase family protein [Aspergillus nomiae NRRL 13137]